MKNFNVYTRIFLFQGKINELTIEKYNKVQGIDDMKRKRMHAEEA